MRNSKFWIKSLELTGLWQDNGALPWFCMRACRRAYFTLPVISRDQSLSRDQGLLTQEPKRTQARSYGQVNDAKETHTMRVVASEGLCGIPATACPHPLYWPAAYGRGVEKTTSFSTLLNPCQKLITWSVCSPTVETAGLHILLLSYVP